MNFTRIILIGVITVILVWAVAVTIDLIDSLGSNEGYKIESISDGYVDIINDSQGEIK